MSESNQVNRRDGRKLTLDIAKVEGAGCGMVASEVQLIDCCG